MRERVRNFQTDTEEVWTRAPFTAIDSVYTFKVITHEPEQWTRRPVNENEEFKIVRFRLVLSVN